MARRRFAPWFALTFVAMSLVDPLTPAAGWTGQDVTMTIALPANGAGDARMRYVQSGGLINCVQGCVFPIDQATVGTGFRLEPVGATTQAAHLAVFFYDGELTTQASPPVCGRYYDAGPVKEGTVCGRTAIVIAIAVDGFRPEAISQPGVTFRYRSNQLIPHVPQPLGRAFEPVEVGPGFEGTPVNVAKQSGDRLEVQSNYLVSDAEAPPTMAASSWEPTIGVDRAGRVFMTAQSRAGQPEIQASLDEGRTWRKISPVLPTGDNDPPQTQDPYVYVDPTTDRVFSIDLQGAMCSWMNSTDDAGATWTRNPLACGIPALNDHQTLVAGRPVAGLAPQGYASILYYCVNHLAFSACSRSLDGGASFRPTRSLPFLGTDEQGEFCGGLHGHAVTDSAGRMFLPKGHCHEPWVAVSEDGGDAWTRSRISSHVRMGGERTAVPFETPHHEVTLAIDSADNVYAVWAGEDRLPYLAYSTDHGSSWSTPRMIAPPNVIEVNFPTIAAGDEGRIVVSFPGTTHPSRTNVQRPWDLYQLVSTDILSKKPLVLWTRANDPADPVHRGNCGPGRCGSMYDFLDVVVSPVDGTFWASGVDTCVNLCVTTPSTLSNDEFGFAVHQTGGPSLWDPSHRAGRARP